MPVMAADPNGARPKYSQLALYHFKDWSQLTIPPRGRQSSHHSPKSLNPIRTPSRSHTSPGHRQPTEPAHSTRGNKPLAEPHHWPLLVHNAQQRAGRSVGFSLLLRPNKDPVSPKTLRIGTADGSSGRYKYRPLRVPSVRRTSPKSHYQTYSTKDPNPERWTTPAY